MKVATSHCPWAAPTLGIPFGSFALGTKPSFIFCVTGVECDYASFVVSPFACTRPPPVVAYSMKPEENMVIHHVFGHQDDNFHHVFGHPTLCIYLWTSYAT